ncbi:MAG: acyltransferase family protein [Bacteroidaceae bacterium]|nr:acyltransferase family protein [Bacteroidaceae bacterium]MDO4994880.1 acyltransferase [Bacteroidales bacterium]
MSRDESLQLKGIAILLMLALHLFSDLDTVTAECDWLIPFWNGKPIVYAFSRVAACCVPIYLFLGGYGLSRTFEQSPQMHNGRRILSLYTNFWIVFLLFIPMACMIRPEDYPKDLPTLALSTIAWTSAYNGAWWFLLPYAVFTLLSAPFMRFVHSHSLRTNLWLLLVAFVIYVGNYLLRTRLEELSGLGADSLRTVTALFVLLPAFYAGAIFARFRLIEKLKQRPPLGEGWGGGFLFLFFILLKMTMGSSSLPNALFAVIYISLFVCLRRSAWFEAVCRYFGRHSTNIWLIHAFFYAHLFHSFIYSPRYPLLIFLLLLAVSLACSYVVRWLYQPLRQRIRGK